jgi:hypothetical protein
VAASNFAAAVDSIHRMFDERKLVEELRMASVEGGAEAYERDQDQELERQGSSFRQLQVKQVVM